LLSETKQTCSNTHTVTQVNMLQSVNIVTERHAGSLEASLEHTLVSQLAHNA
jgi:hypothetical protein